MAPGQAAIFIGFLVVASACDLRTRRIPNRLNAAGLLAVVAVAFAEDRAGGVACIGWAFTLAAGPLAIHLARPAGLGGGDVKMTAVIGAALGPLGALALVVGCLMALLALPAARSIGWLPAAARHIPLAPFLAAGALATMAGT